LTHQVGHPADGPVQRLPQSLERKAPTRPGIAAKPADQRDHEDESAQTKMRCSKIGRTDGSTYFLDTASNYDYS
jgi:hypothetical protein